MLLLSCLPIARAEAQTAKPASNIKVEVVPATVEVPTGGRKAKAVAVVRNESGDTLQDVRLSYWADASVTAELDPRKPRSLPPNTDLSWSLTLSRGADDVPVHGSVHLRVDYKVEAKEKQTAVSHVIFGTIDTKEPETETVDPVADVQIKTEMESLDDLSKAWVYLVITSKAKTRLGVSVDAKWPYPVEIDKCRPEPVVIPLEPLATELVSFPIQATKRVSPGKHLIVFDVALTWGDPKRLLTRHVIVTHDVGVSVFGESAAILTVLGVPTLLALPGFLILVTVQLLWEFKLFKSKHDPGQYTLEAKSAPFWMLAVTLSIIVIGGYWLAVDSGFPKYYKLMDLITIWFSSVVLGVAGYGIGMAVRNKGLRQRTIFADDDPLTILRKLLHLGLGTYLTRYDVGTAAAPMVVFLFEPHDEHREMSWVGPPIEVRWQTPAVAANPAADQAAADQAAVAALDAAIQGQLNLANRADPVALANALSAASDSGFFTIAWGQVLNMNSLEEMKTQDLKSRLPAASIIDYGPA